MTGLWLNREPLGESESLNLYAYCHNDPVNKVDVPGLAATDVGTGLSLSTIDDPASYLPDLTAGKALNGSWWSLASQWQQAYWGGINLDIQEGQRIAIAEAASNLLRDAV